MTISERVAYIKGLAEGMELPADTKEGKILHAIIDVLEDIGYELEELNDNQLDIGEELDAISDDLGDVEEYVFGPECCGDDDDCCCCDDDDDDDGCCCGCGDDDDCCCGDEEDLEFEVTCPECSADIALTEADLMKGAIVCPSCGEKLEFEYDGDEDEE